MKMIRALLIINSEDPLPLSMVSELLKNCWKRAFEVTSMYDIAIDRVTSAIYSQFG